MTYKLAISLIEDNIVDDGEGGEVIDWSGFRKDARKEGVGDGELEKITEHNCPPYIEDGAIIVESTWKKECFEECKYQRRSQDEH